MDSKTVNELWQAITEYGEAERELGNEGNSGEFHDPKEFRVLSKITNDCYEKVIEKFGKLTKHRLIKLNKFYVWVSESEIREELPPSLDMGIQEVKI